jgi:hypothetical protein
MPCSTADKALRAPFVTSTPVLSRPVRQRTAPFTAPRAMPLTRLHCVTERQPQMSAWRSAIINGVIRAAVRRPPVRSGIHVRGELLESALPTVRRSDGSAHPFPAVTVPIEMAVFELDTGSTRSLRNEPHVVFARAAGAYRYGMSSRPNRPALNSAVPGAAGPIRMAVCLPTPPPVSPHTARSRTWLAGLHAGRRAIAPCRPRQYATNGCAFPENVQ